MWLDVCWLYAAIYKSSSRARKDIYLLFLYLLFLDFKGLGVCWLYVFLVNLRGWTPIRIRVLRTHARRVVGFLVFVNLRDKFCIKVL